MRHTLEHHTSRLFSSLFWGQGVGCSLGKLQLSALAWPGLLHLFTSHLPKSSLEGPWTELAGPPRGCLLSLDFLPGRYVTSFRPCV